jgi:hypothetical protein
MEKIGKTPTSSSKTMGKHRKKSRKGRHMGVTHVAAHNAKRGLLDETTVSDSSRVLDRLYVFKNTLWCASTGCVPCAYKIVVKPPVGTFPQLPPCVPCTVYIYLRPTINPAVHLCAILFWQVGSVQNLRPSSCRRFPTDPLQEKKNKSQELVGLPEWGIGDKTGNVLLPGGCHKVGNTDPLRELSLYQVSPFSQASSCALLVRAELVASVYSASP